MWQAGTRQRRAGSEINSDAGRNLMFMILTFCKNIIFAEVKIRYNLNLLI